MRTRYVIVLLVLLVYLLLAYVFPAVAQTGGGYDLTWNSVDGGGTMFSTGGNYALGGTIGQPDAGLLSGGSYTLAGGFWSAARFYRIFLPVVLR